jgi:hypothetical protein
VAAHLKSLLRRRLPENTATLAQMRRRHLKRPAKTKPKVPTVPLAQMRRRGGAKRLADEEALAGAQ